MRLKPDIAVKDIMIYQGADFTMQLQFKTKDENDTVSNIDVTGYKFQAAVRASAEDCKALATFTVKDVDATNGIIELKIPAADTSKIDTTGDYYKQTDKFYWDLIMTDANGDTQRVVNGTAYVSPGISQERKCDK